MQAGADVDRFSRSRWRRGYDVDEVDAFVERIELTMAGYARGNAVTVDEVRAVQFTVVKGGYATDEVAMFLEHVVRQLRLYGAPHGVPAAPAAPTAPAAPREPEDFEEAAPHPAYVDYDDDRGRRDARFPAGPGRDEPVPPVAFPGNLVEDDGWNGHALGIPLAAPLPEDEQPPAAAPAPPPPPPPEAARPEQASQPRPPARFEPPAHFERPEPARPPEPEPEPEPDNPLGLDPDEGANILAVLAFANVVLGQRGARFPRRPERGLGYNVANVDDFVEQVGATLNSTLTVATVRTVVFGSERGGYDDAAVTEWLEQVVDRIMKQKS